MTDARQKRNSKIKEEITRLRAQGYLLKEAIYAVMEKYYLSYKQVERVYYETVVK